MYVTFLTKIIGKAVYLKTDSHAPAVDRMADQFEIRSWYRFCSSLDDKKKKKKSKRFVLGLSWCCLQTMSANERSEYLQP